jgi:soluble lytic murein transglycosylase
VLDPIAALSIRADFGGAVKNVRLSPARLALATGALLGVLVFAPSLRSTAELPAEPLSAPLTLPAPTATAPEASAAAQALRKGDVQAAHQHLEALARQRPAEASRLRVVAGLAEHEAGTEAAAAARLAAAADPGGPFEDWRLLLLGEMAAERGDQAAALDWYDQLLATCLGSPLAPGAWLEAARLAGQLAGPREALDRIEAARSAGVAGEAAAELEKLAWEAATELADPAAGREAARRLFVDAPLGSAAQEAARGFHAFAEPLDWASLLTRGEAHRRATILLAADHPAAALSTLDRLPEGDRDLAWHLLRARTLTEDHRGDEALQRLAPLAGLASPADRAALAWERALAAADAAGVWRGRTNLPTALRRERLAASHRHLREVVQIGMARSVDPELTAGALRRLAEGYMDQGLTEPALDALRLLRTVDPSDVTGSNPLWETGWAEYRRGNWTGAIGAWTELAEIYPDTGNAQRGLYWKARALEQLGRPDRARDLYARLVAESDTSDFYGRRAHTRLARLGGAPAGFETASFGAQARAEAGIAPQPWRLDPRLRRAKQLSDLGLDRLALRELELAGRTGFGRAGLAQLAQLAQDIPPRRDRLALEGVILGRQGNRAASVQLLRQAYPALGGPRQATVPAEVLYAYYPLEYRDSLAAHARAQGLPPSLVAGLIRQESAFNPSATSRVGASGLMQLMPATARETAARLRLPAGATGGRRLENPEINLRLGTAYLRQVIDMFDGDLELALAGYNGGPNRIRRLWNEAGPQASLDEFVEQLALSESRDYVKRVLVLSDSYRQLYPSLGGTSAAGVSHDLETVGGV